MHSGSHSFFPHSPRSTVILNKFCRILSPDFVFTTPSPLTRFLHFPGNTLFSYFSREGAWVAYFLNPSIPESVFIVLAHLNGRFTRKQNSQSKIISPQNLESIALLSHCCWGEALTRWPHTHCSPPQGLESRPQGEFIWVLSGPLHQPLLGHSLVQQEVFVHVMSQALYWDFLKWNISCT